MKVSLGVRVDYKPGSYVGEQVPNESKEIKPDGIGVVFSQAQGGMKQQIEIYFMDEDRKVGRITLSPFEFRKIWEQGLDVLRENNL